MLDACRPRLLTLAVLWATACTSTGGPAVDAGADAADAETTADAGTARDAARGDATSADAKPADGDAGPRDSMPDASTPELGGCPILPRDHVFNTPIDREPVHPSSEAFLATIGPRRFHLDLGTTVDPSSETYWGIPFNLVHGDTMTWREARFFSADPELDWDTAAESDCASGSRHDVVSPCPGGQSLFPIPDTPRVEGGVVTDPSQPYGDHHILLLDVDTCRLWELYHAYPSRVVAWDIYGSASFDLRSNALRPAGWSSADAAGFPMLPLLLRAEEASTGAIHHALRFTIDTHKIRPSYVWPARHKTNNGRDIEEQPPMGQLFRLKASYTIPASFHAQSRAILQAMKTYGLYLADGGSDMYVTGDPSDRWEESTFDEVQSVSNAELEAVDLSGIMARPGFDPDSGAVPPP